MRLRLLGVVALVFLVNTGYIAAFGTPSLFYMANALLHLVLGLVLVALCRAGFSPRGTSVPLILTTILGLILAYVGNTRDHRTILILHVIIGTLAIAALLAWSLRSRQIALTRALIAGSLIALALPAITASYHRVRPNPHDRIVNPLIVPTSMEEEGAGPKSPFLQSILSS